ncbi:MAG: putative glycine dehydrogenase (decarboxylating) subunit 2 [Firmicutes bacterium ADurb.Bin080]|nr:MAG: putative glycine dehydrogenase (decarboxylating) subunit 2 [Firmicutes bacterium ADurb.Bin080]
MLLIFEKSQEGKKGVDVRKPEVKEYSYSSELLRSDLDLPEVSEVDAVRHFTELSKRAFGVDDGFYPLGSCTMKYNPKINEEVASLKGFTDIHPLQPEEDAQGALEGIYMLSQLLSEITGMDAVSLQPAAGAHGEYTGLRLISSYHKSRGDIKRNKIIVPDSAHGTNPASATMAGFEVINVKSNEEKGVDLDELRAVVGEDTAALMLTNPTTLGLFEKNIVEIAEIVHNAGGLLYYDGANLNAVMGIVRPGDMGFDVVHLNLHKTFSTPHGGGGPGSGPVGCKMELAPYLPNPSVVKYGDEYFFVNDPDSIGKVGSFYGNFLVYVRALTYILTLGKEGIPYSAKIAVLNANYLKKKLQDIYTTEKKRHCMHEFVLSLEKLKEETGVSAMDVAKSMIDYKMHPPTMYFPMIVHEALMFEPTETENKETLDSVADLLRKLHEMAYSDPAVLKSAPHSTVISRPDEVTAARKPIVRYKKP